MISLLAERLSNSFSNNNKDSEYYYNLIYEIFTKQNVNFNFEGKHASYQEIIDGIKTVFLFDYNFAQDEYNYKLVVFKGTFPTTQLGTYASVSVWQRCVSVLIDFIEKVLPRVVKFEAIWDGHKNNPKVRSEFYKKVIAFTFEKYKFLNESYDYKWKDDEENNITYFKLTRKEQKNL